MQLLNGQVVLKISMRITGSKLIPGCQINLMAQLDSVATAVIYCISSLFWGSNYVGSSPKDIKSLKMTHGAFSKDTAKWNLHLGEVIFT